MRKLAILTFQTLDGVHFALSIGPGKYHDYYEWANKFLKMYNGTRGLVN